jgi:hypothetical protein
MCDSVNSNNVSNTSDQHSQIKKDENFTKSSKQSSDLVSVTVINSSVSPRKLVFLANDNSDDNKTVKVTTPNSKKPPICEKLNKCSLISLEEREMPITRESIASKVGTNQVRVDYSTGDSMENKSTTISNDLKSGSNEDKTR